ncbi:MAG: sigma-70 family RNA polymerase sigma factor [Deltaproteobacteria bacterium]|nr:sigma-70 family RNA polymerase sigma factor [Deltaproteobacteria bacterium]
MAKTVHTKPVARAKKATRHSTRPTARAATPATAATPGTDDEDAEELEELEGAASKSVPVVDLSDAEPEPAPKKADDKRLLKTDPEDHLSTYFRDLAVHELLGPEQERELAQGIEDQEILTWERVFERPEAIALAAKIVDGKTEQPVLAWKKLVKAAETVVVVPRKKRDPRVLARLAKVGREVAEPMRALDLDRLHIDAVIRELERTDVRARKGEKDLPLAAGTAEYTAYLDKIRSAYRGSSQLREEFVRANLRLVVTMARRYDRGGMPLADLIQEGNLGLMHAVSRFDYRRGLRFSTYACWWIRHAIGRALADKARAVRIPVHMLEAQQQLEKVRQGLIGELGRQPSPQELAKAARVPLAKLNQMHRYLMGQPMSLDRPIHDDDDRAFGDMLADPATEDASPADDMTTSKLTSQVGKLLHHLSPIEADVLRQRFGLVNDEERTFREIGDQYHLSRERIRQIQNSALDKLKKALEREHRGHVEQ